MCPQIWIGKKTVSQDGWTRYELSDGIMSRMFGSQTSTMQKTPFWFKAPETTEHTKQH